VKHEGLGLDPCSPYAAQKLATETLAKVYTGTMGVGTIPLRYFNVFGPYQDPQSDYAAVIPAFVHRMLRGQNPVIFGDGLQSRDFTFVGDVVAANIAAMNAPDSACGRPYNIACGHRTSLLDLVEQLNRVLVTRLAPEHQEERAGDVKHSLADISRAKEVLSWQPQVSFEEGLRRTVEWIQSTG
jgi:UDP-glucose 4-epimerase